MNKYVFYNFDYSKSLLKIGESMLEREYQEELGKGFILTNSQKDIVEGEYITKQIVEDSFFNPLGQKLSFQSVKYHITKFIITKGCKINLRISDPPLRYKDFFTELLDIVKFDATLSRINLNLENVVDLLKKEFTNVTVTKIIFTDININDKGIGELNVKSENDIYHDAIKYLSNKFYTIKTMKCRISDNKRTGTVEIASNGALTIESCIKDTVLLLIPKFI